MQCAEEARPGDGIIEIHGVAIFHPHDDHFTLGGLPFHEDIGCKAHVCVYV